jgi:hypothetical protein
MNVLAVDIQMSKMNSNKRRFEFIKKELIFSVGRITITTKYNRWNELTCAIVHSLLIKLKTWIAIVTNVALTWICDYFWMFRNHKACITKKKDDIINRKDLNEYTYVENLSNWHIYYSYPISIRQTIDVQPKTAK